MKNKIFILVLTLVFCVGVVHGENSYQSIYMQDFSSVKDISSNLTPQPGKAFSATASDGALDMKSDSLCFFRATNMFNSLGEANSAVNSHGVEYYTNWFVKGARLETPETSGDYTFNYTITQGGTNALILDDTYGLPAFGTVSYKGDSNNPVKVNEIKFNVTNGGFTEDYNTVKLRVKAYADKANAPLNIVYVRADNGQYATVNLFKFTEEEAGTWVTKEITVSNIDLTKKIIQDPGRYEQQYTMKFNTNRGYDVLLHSVEILKADGEVNSSAPENMYLSQIQATPLYGDAYLTYDIDFKDGEICCSDTCTDGCIPENSYNSGKNQMSVNLLNQHKQKIASVRYDLDGDSVVISLAYTDGTDTAYMEVYRGEYADKVYTCKLGYDMENARNTLSIYDGEALIAQTGESLDMVNKDLAERTFAQYYSVNHNQTSDAIFSTVDNIGVDFSENSVYKSFQEDLAAISLPDVVRENFELPVTGAVNGNEVIWNSSDSSVLSIDGGYASINRGVEEDIPVVLTATISDGVFTVSADYTVHIKALKGEFIDVSGIAETDNGDNVTACTTVINAGTTGAKKISLVAVAYKDDEIIDIGICEKEVTDVYEKIDFEVSVAKGDMVDYLIWDENTVPIINHIPHIYSSDFGNKARGGLIEWEKAYDDFGAVDSYQIKRSDGELFVTDGESYGENRLRFFDRYGEENEEYTYELVALDSNQKASETITGKASKIPMPYSMELNGGYTSDDIYDGGNHISFIFKRDSARAAHTVPSVYLGENCIFIPNGKYAAFTTDMGSIKNNIAVRFTYATPKTTKFKFMYNQINPDGSSSEISEKDQTYSATDGWQTVDFKLEKDFGGGLTFSNGHFGLGSSSSEGVYIKKIEFIQLGDYE